MRSELWPQPLKPRVILVVAAHQLRHSWHAEVRELCYRVADAILSREALREPWLDTLATERSTGLTTKKLLTDDSSAGLGFY